MTYSKKKKATNRANCVSLITEERAREIVDKRDREANALFNIINSLGSIYLTYFEALKKLNDQFKKLNDQFKKLNEQFNFKMLANEEKYNIKKKDNDNKSNI